MTSQAVNPGRLSRWLIPVNKSIILAALHKQKGPDLK